MGRIDPTHLSRGSTAGPPLFPLRFWPISMIRD
jgi:hypothetical protein